LKAISDLKDIVSVYGSLAAVAEAYGTKPLLHHSTGTATVEGGEVVLRFSGITGGLFHKKEQWAKEMRVPLDEAGARIEKEKFGKVSLAIYRNGVIEQTLMDCKPEDMAEILAKQINGGSVDTPLGWQWVEEAATGKPELVVKVYKSTKEFQADSKKMIRRGWAPQNQAALDGHVSSAAGLVLGGLLLGGASRTNDQLSVTWIRARTTTSKKLVPKDALPHVAPTHQSLVAPTSGSDDIPTKIRELAELKERGILTSAEFEAKKTELLARM
jgi:hypothetical protein